MPQPVDISWELIPFDFALDWVFDPDFGWLRFCWFPEERVQSSAVGQL